MTRRPRWRRPALAGLGGVLLYVGHPPVGLGAAGLVALVPLVALARELAADSDLAVSARARLGATYGALAGIIAFGAMVPWLIPFGFVAYLGLVLVQAAYISVFMAVAAALGERRGRAVVTVAAWVAFESVRGAWPLSGFAWGGLAYTQADGGLVLGLARTLGPAGISAVLATVAVAVEEAIHEGFGGWARARTTAVPGDALFTAMRTPILTVLGVLSLAVLLAGEAPPPTGDTTELAVVQGGDTRATSAAGVNRIDSDRIIRVTDLMLEATRPLADDPPEVVVWPENSLDADVRTPDGAAVAERLDTALQLVAPAPILAGETAEGPRPRTLHNNMTVFTQDDIGPSYTKQRPVPFGEFVPAREALDWFPPLRQIPFDVVPGGGAQVIPVAGARVGAVICFENTFPDLAREQVRAGADVLVVSTNNSSFGQSAMSAQHLQFSRLRAVETGRWVVHAGISGISAFIDPDGGLHQVTRQFEAEVIRMDVPLVEGLTPAVRLGDAVAWLAVAVALSGLLLTALAAHRRT